MASQVNAEIAKYIEDAIVTQFSKASQPVKMDMATGKVKDYSGLSIDTYGVPIIVYGTAKNEKPTHYGFLNNIEPTKLVIIDDFSHLTNPKNNGKLPKVEKSMEKQVPQVVTFWQFGEDTTKGNATPEILGGKGCGLVEMARAGLPVPPGIIIPPNAAKNIFDFLGDMDDAGLHDIATEAHSMVLNTIAPQLGYNKGEAPLVSVRSGARVSMPGMMDTILNVGISKKNLTYWQNRLGDRAALDCLIRLMKMYGTTVCGIGADEFDHCLSKVLKSKYGQKELPTSEKTMSIDHQWKLIEKYETLYDDMDQAFPNTLEDQLGGAIGAVFKSWNSARAKAYRKMNNIPDDWGTACIVQAMVFGNRNEQSCSGVLFSRDPSTGENTIMGEYLANAQGEEVVSGTATPDKFENMHHWNADVRHALVKTMMTLENRYLDMVDVEFTVDDGKLWILQARAGKRTAQAAFSIAYDLVQEGIIDKATALKRVTVKQYQELNKAIIDPAYKVLPIAKGSAGSKGIAIGKVWLSKEKAMANPGGILVTKETTPDDYAGMVASAGILTATGGTTSHAAVVARAENKACVVGCTTMVIGSNVAFHHDNGILAVEEGITITIDGNTGNVYLGELPMVGGTGIPDHVKEMIEWGSNGVVIQYDATDTLPDEGEVYLDCAALHTKDELLALMDKLGQKPKLEGVLTFKVQPKFDDSKFLKMLALKSEPQNMTIDQAFVLIDHLSDHDAAKNWTVLTGGGYLPGKFRQFNRVKTLKEFMGCDGYYEVEDDLKKLLAEQGMTVEEFATFLKNSGKTMKRITKPVTRDQLAFSVFAK